MKLLTYLCIATLSIMWGLSNLSSHAAVSDDGLILYLGFDRESGGTVKDGTAGENDGTLTAGAEITTQEKVHGAGSLEIIDQNASVQVDSFQELAEYQDNSYIFWIYFIQGTNGAWSQIIAKPAPGADRSPGIWVRPNELGIHYRFNPGNKGAGYVGPDGNNTQFQTKKWYHIAGVRAGTKLTFYVDGVAKAEYNDIPAQIDQGADKLYIGKSPRYRAATFHLDDLYIFNRALSADEIIEVKDGLLLPVEPKDKLATTWGKLKTHRD